MDAEFWRKVKAIASDASERNDATRDAYVARACGGDEALHKAVLSHLEQPEEMGQSLTLSSPDLTLDSPSQATPGPLAAGMRFDKYELIREIGRGGMGTVFLARDLMLARRVAVKFLTDDDPARAARFRAEARTTAQCKHDNIVDIYDVGEINGHSYLVLEHLEGVTLRAWLKARSRPDGRSPISAIDPIADTDAAGEPAAHSAEPARAAVSATLAVEMIVPVVRALAHAHERGIVHRDLKPANVMLTDAGSIKVLDFGIAKVLDQPASVTPDDGDRRKQWAEREFRTGVGSIVGSRPYMSPEQWRGEEVDERSDLWAVGVMLWELLAGHHPLAPLSLERLEVVASLTDPMPSLTDRRPDIAQLGDIVDRCLTKPKHKRIPSSEALLEQLESLAVSPTEPADAGLADAPYAGLAVFQEGDSSRFFGREQDVASMIVRARNHPLVTVTGPSGAGKSSFIRAGVLPALKRADARWQAFIVRPGRHPLAALTDVLAELNGRATGVQDDATRTRDIDRLRAQPGWLGSDLRAYCRERRRRALLFVDQFEELYTLTRDPAERAAFVACLEGAADDASSPVRVVLTLRSDFLERVADDRELMGEVTRGLVFLSPIARAGLRDALTRPLARTGYRFETEAMVETMLDELDATRTPLPLLQFTADRLWDAREREHQLLTQASYDQLGGVGGALATHADSVIMALSRREHAIARVVFTSLVTEERTRAIVSQPELRALVADRDGDALEQVVQELASARLVIIQTGEERGGVTVELSHESLIDRWPELGHWLDEDEDEALFLARLRGAARQWDQAGRTEDLLWRGEVATDAAMWLDRWRGDRGGEPGDRVIAAAGVELGARDHSFLRAVVTLAARGRRRRRRIATAMFAGISAVAVVVSVLAVHADREADRAENLAAETARQADRIARQGERVAAEAMQTRNALRIATAREHTGDPTLVLSLLRELEPGAPPLRWHELVRTALSQGVARAVLRHPYRLQWAEFSPDGTRVVTASNDIKARVWNADGTGQPIVLRGHSNLVRHASFSPDGTLVVTASHDGTARVWNADGTGQPIVLRGHENRVHWASFSPDGARIVTASRDKTARVWNADGTGEPMILRGHRERLYSAVFSPSGGRIVTTSMDGTARVWNADGTGEPMILRGHTDRVYTAMFSADGARIVTASRDQTARVWNADGSGQPVILEGHEHRVYAAAFSPDGARVVTASWDHTARIWSADGTGEPIVLRGHRSRLNSAAFSPDGTRIVTASEDHTARIWDANNPHRVRELHGHEAWITAVTFSPAGDRIASSAKDNTVRIWSPQDAREMLVLRGHEDWVQYVAFNADGTRIVTASTDRTVRVWNADGTGAPVVLRGHEGRVMWAAFSPDSTKVVSASWDGTARVWNSDGTGQPRLLQYKQQKMVAAEFSPDGRRIVTATANGTAQVWSADGAGQPMVFRGHDKELFGARFSPDGARVVTASADSTAQVWSADGSGDPIVLSDHQGRVIAAGFNSLGTRIVTLSDDRTMRVWNADGRGQPLILRDAGLSPTSVAFSPDGTRAVSASHETRVMMASGAERVTYHARVWPDIEPLSGPEDIKLWTATRDCLPLDRRAELLNLPLSMARENLARCQRLVAEAARRAGR